MTLDEKIALVKNIIMKHRNNFLTVDFRKKDGSLRTMQVHRSKLLESQVKGTMPEATAARKETLKRRNMVCVEEIVKPGCSEHQWRTINCETVTRIAFNGNEIRFSV